MKITKEILKQIQKDIEICDNQKNKQGSEMLYNLLIARYTVIDPHFKQGLPTSSKVAALGEEFDYRMEIKAISEKLKMILQINKQGSAENANSEMNMKEKVKEEIGLSNKKVFIVHGHDDLAKLEVARLIEKFDLEAIILHEQSNSGKTVIEKIEENSDVRYAVVLYTPCDLGRTKENNVEEEQARARQNVVFEHGYLIGKLGRQKVTALIKEKVETPGDISGVVYISMDKAGAWKTELAREMKTAGLEVDMNKL